MNVQGVTTSTSTLTFRHAGAPEPDPARGAAPPQATRGSREASAAATSAPAQVQAVGARGPADPLGLAGLPTCVEDAARAAARRSDGPPDPTRFSSLRTRLETAVRALPERYRKAVGEPLLLALDELGARGLAQLLAEDPEREGGARLLLDAAQAVLQHGEGYQPRATAAFQEVVSDLYEGFLADEKRAGVKPPGRGAVPPLVRWGSAEAGPYTWPVTATRSLGLEAPVVSLPAANASGGLLAWAALAHETAGHDLLAADVGLQEELGRTVRAALLGSRTSPVIAGYWAERIDETASDVLGVLNMGPAAAVGLIGYLRGVNGAWGGTAALRSEGAATDPHPTDLARAYLVAETVRLLHFTGAGTWADRLIREADRDLGHLTLGDVAVTAGVARASAAEVARAIVTTRLGALEGHALGDLQGWTDQDEAIVAALRPQLAGGGAAGGGSAAPYVPGAYAAHAVAAGVYEAVSGRTDPSRVQRRMEELLATMHAANPKDRTSSQPPAHLAATLWLEAGRRGG